MILIDNLFGGIHFYYENKKNEDPRFNGALGIAMVICLLMLCLDFTIGIFAGKELFSFLPYGYYMPLPILLLLFYFVNRYFNKRMAEKIMTCFQAKSISTKRNWLMLYVLVFFALLVLNIVLIQIRHGKL